MSSLIKNGVVDPQEAITLDNKVATTHRNKEMVKSVKIEKTQSELDTEIVLLKKIATDKGYSEGKQSAAEELKKQLDEIQKKNSEMEISLRLHHKTYEDELLRVKARLEKHNQQLVELFESRLLALTLECLYKLTGQKDIYKNIVEENIRRCLSQKDYANKIYIRLPESSSAQFKFLNDDLNENCVLLFEQSLEPGQCLITSGHTTEDTSLSTLLEQVKNQFVSTFNAKHINV